MNHRTVLLVDDHATTRKLVRLALERAAFVVHEAKDGATAITLMQRHHPALVLQDLMLPDVDGFALAARLRALAGSTPVRLLAFSGLISNLDGKRMTSVGFDDVIAKPIAPSRLVTLIEAHSASLEPASDTFGANKCVLVVDDDPGQLHLTTFHLTRLGFRVEEACDGEHGLALARAHKPDIVVSDVLMPRLDGFGLAIAMRREETFANTPLVLVTSTYLEPSDRELGLRAGADDFVVRTPGLEELVRALRLLSARGPRRVVSAGAPVVSPELEREHARRTARQLERQVAQNSELMRRSSLLSAELTIMTSLSEAVLQQRDVESALVTALSTCFDAINSSLGALYLFDRHQHLRARALGTCPNIDATAIATFFGQERWLRELVGADTSVLFSGSDSLGENAREVLVQANVQRAIVVPLVYLSQPLGALFMAARNEDHTVEFEQWRVFAQGIANQITQVLALADAFQAREVAEREAEQQKRLARDQAAMWRALVEHVPDVVMQLDLAGRVRFINRSPTGQPLERIRNELWCDSMRVECRADMQVALASVLRDGQPRTIETRGLGPAGTLTWHESHLGPVRAGADKTAGEIVGALVVQRDVTQKRQAEAQAASGNRFASAGLLAADLAHQINNPLSSVTTNLELALRDVGRLPANAVSSELLDELRDAQKAAEQVRRIVQDLMLFSHADQDAHEAATLQRLGTTPVVLGVLAPTRRARVLLVDDEPLVAQVVRRALTKEHDVHCISGADEAFRLVLAGERFDVILCDLSMPQSTGMDFHQELARSYPEQAERMVFFTGGAFTTRTKEFLRQVQNHRLEKPIDGHQLQALVNGLVR